MEQVAGACDPADSQALMQGAAGAEPQVEAFFDPATSTVSYLVWDRDGGSAAVIDPVLDFDQKSGRTQTHSADRVVAAIQARQLELVWILETHAHADHLSAAQYLKRKLGGRIAIGEHIREVQATFRKVFNLEPAFAVDGTQFDHLFADGECFRIGALEACAMHVPGHTPADLAYRVGETVFVGDTLFMPDVGTARCDFPGGDARVLYRSLRKLLSMPDDTRLYVCHDYPPAEREPAWETTVSAQRADNIHVRDGVPEDEFVRMRETRDASLEMPALIIPAIQVNVRAGAFPPTEDDGVSYLKIPIDVL